MAGECPRYYEEPRSPEVRNLVKSYMDLDPDSESDQTGDSPSAL